VCVVTRAGVKVNLQQEEETIKPPPPSRTSVLPAFPVGTGGGEEEEGLFSGEK
jgi:hypothetical protein